MIIITNSYEIYNEILYHCHNRILYQSLYYMRQKKVKIEKRQKLT